MAFELTTNNFNNGQGYVVMPLLATLMLFSSLTPPVELVDMRAELEAAQPQPFTDDDWSVLVKQLAAVQLVDSSLTADERSVYNTLRVAASPPPSTRCCGTVTPSSGDGATEAYLYMRTGSATWETKIELHIDKAYTCDIATIEVVLAEVGAAPPNTVGTPVDLVFQGCNDLGRAVYSYYWAEFTANPLGFDYNFELNYKDASGGTIAVYARAADTTVQ